MNDVLPTSSVISSRPIASLSCWVLSGASLNPQASGRVEPTDEEVVGWFQVPSQPLFFVSFRKTRRNSGQDYCLSSDSWGALPG